MCNTTSGIEGVIHNGDEDIIPQVDADADARYDYKCVCLLHLEHIGTTLTVGQVE